MAEMLDEGGLAVGGAVLHYRLAGPAGARHTLVFENGWSGTLPYAHWFEALRPAEARVLFYDRAGIGGSRATAPLTVAGVTQQLQGLLAGLGIAGPVVLMGHSYGGLIGALHAAQAPGRVRALVQIDATSEFENPLIDAELRLTPRLGRLMQGLTLVGLDQRLLGPLRRELPPEALSRLRPGIGARLRSLQGAIDEFELQEALRAVVRDAAAARACPRLVISADAKPPPPGLFKRRAQVERAAAVSREFRALHQRQAALSPHSRWLALPYGHVSLVTNREAAAAIWARTLDFIHHLPDQP